MFAASPSLSSSVAYFSFDSGVLKSRVCCDNLQHTPHVWSAHPLKLNSVGHFSPKTFALLKSPAQRKETLSRKKKKTEPVSYYVVQLECRRPSRVSHWALKHMIRITFLPALLEVVRRRLPPRHLFCRLHGGNVQILWCENAPSNSNSGTDGKDQMFGWTCQFVISVGTLQPLRCVNFVTRHVRSLEGFWFASPSCLNSLSI